MSDSDIVKDFLQESSENLDRLDRELVGLEKNPRDADALASVFRTIHTIKGTCGFLGFDKLEKVAHVGENLLTRLRDGKLTLNPEITTGLLTMVDAVRQMLKEIESTGQDGDDTYPELLQTLSRLQEPAAGDATSSTAQAQPPKPTTKKPLEEPRAETPAPEKAGAPPKHAEIKALSAKFRPVRGKMGGLLVERGLLKPEELAIALEEQDKGDRRRLGDILVSLNLAKPEDINAVVQFLESRTRETAPETIRVGVNLLDKLMTLVGELVLARNQLLQLSNTSRDAGLQAVSQRMNLIATELQEEVMKTRMQPIGNIWSQFPRTVRDVALGCGKQVEIEMVGKDTELDKTIIEAIKDPLTHLVRNSVDHGIELPEDRARAGKDPTGRLTLRAFHEGGQVIIEISDDGAGLNVERIRQKAVERGLVTAEQAPRMAEREIFNLIFLPGFSTAQKVTNVSGRGVGMDVVKTNVEKIGGTVDLQSSLGLGTTVRVKIPLTLAIIPALIVTCGGDRYAIPQVSLLELVRLEDTKAVTGIELVHGVPVHRLRGRLLPIVYLRRELRIGDSGQAKNEDDAVNIVVLQADGRQFGLVVDTINDTEEIVVKPLRKQLKSIKTFAGASIMGDGKVALILDVVGLAQRASVVSETKEHAEAAKAAEAAAGSAQKRSYLLFSGPDDAHMAIPLDTLARLEELPVSQVEKTGTRWVAQYRGQILPLVNLGYALLERRTRRRSKEFEDIGKAERYQVLVCNHEGHRAGLVVERIVDIVEDSAEVKYPASREGVLYSAVIQGRVTEMIDVPAVLQAAQLESEVHPEHAEVTH
ncbi:MAG TPA: chemotaxis protein CheW [Candidatus Acidoferrum sp.]|nr:chemotaxis protein CheW [Candidatus Acidoferrum sp.]